jgi:hypothetical protein
MPGKLEELSRRAKQAARELNEKYDITGKLDQAAQATTDALRKGADAAAGGLEKAKEKVTTLDREHRVSERVAESARKAAEKIDDVVTKSGAKEKASEVASEARSAASNIYGEAKSYYKSASSAAHTTVSAARLPSSILKAVSSAREWMKENPGKAAIVSIALVAGTRAGSAFSSLDMTLLGAGGAGNWLFHSAVVPYGLRRLSQKYESYLKKQEALMRDGKLDEAERARVKFQRDAARYVGAPLLGAFSVAAGAGLVYEAFTGAVVTGFPINLVIGGNPLLSSLWLFGNGLVCFHNGYKFFMMALGDQEEVARVVRDIKGLLPAASEG